AARQRLLQEITEEEPPASQAPRRRLAQRPGERGGWLDLEWDLAAVDGDSALFGIVVDLERRLQQWFLQLAPRVGNAKQRCDRSSRIRPEPIGDPLLAVGNDGPGRERCTDPRAPVPRPKSPHLELGDWDEVDELTVAPP